MRYLIALGLIAALIWGGYRWFEGDARAAEAALRAEIAAAPPPGRAGGVPQSVLDFVAVSGAAPVNLARAVRFTQEAEIEMERGEGFSALSAEQIVATGTPAFVWIAEQPVGPVTGFKIVDAFLGGEGRLTVRILGLVPVVDATGPDLSRGEAMRYIAELPLFPDAILGNPDLVWRSVGPREVAVAMEVPGAAPVEVTLLLDEAGDIAEMRATGRPSLGPDGVTTLRDWRGYFRNWGEMGGRRIPRAIEVGYVYEDGYAPYYRGRITSYELID